MQFACEVENMGRIYGTEICILFKLRAADKLIGRHACVIKHAPTVIEASSRDCQSFPAPACPYKLIHSQACRRWGSQDPPVLCVSLYALSAAIRCWRFDSPHVVVGQALLKLAQISNLKVTVAGELVHTRKRELLTFQALR